MSFRTVIITSRCKLEYSLNYLICRGEDEKRINISEISLLIIQNVGVAITAALLSKLMESKVKVIFCDPKSNPQGELVSYYDNYDNYEKIQSQLAWEAKTKDLLWRYVTQEKIINQARNLGYLANPNEFLLKQYAQEVQPGDPTNREGHSAKVYFSSCFGKDFTRDDRSNPINGFLNYGYSIILSCINREIKAFGYLTEFGIHHIGTTNPFNLSCDFMEPLRPFVDYYVLSKKVNADNFKTESVNILSEKVSFKQSMMYLDNAIHLYVQSLLLALNGNNAEKAEFIAYELH